MANDLSARMRMARLMGGGGGDSDGIRPVRRTSGTAVSDSSGGKVTVQLAGGDPIEVPCTTAVKAGDTVSLLVSGGVATAVGVAGWGDSMQKQVDETKAEVDDHDKLIADVKQDVADYKATASATYATKTEVDDKTGAITKTLEADYLKSSDALETYAEKSELASAVDGISSTLSASYTKTADLAKTDAVKDAKKAGTDASAALDAYKSNVSETYATKTALTQTSDTLSASISDALTTAKSYTDSSITTEVTNRNAAIQAKADSISLEVSKTYTKAETFAAYQSDADSRIATANSNASTAKSTAQTAASDAATAKTQSSTAVSTANTASSNASKAVTTANTASSNASAAVSTANGAKTTANKAESTANSASATANAAKSTVDGMQIGGRNLYTETRAFSGNKWINVGSWPKEDETYNGFAVRSCSAQWNGTYQYVDAKSGESFVLSGYFKAEAGSSIYAFFATDQTTTSPRFKNIAKASDDVTSWTRFSVKFDKLVDGKTAARLENGVDGKKLCVCGLKLERGTKATDWTPAPEDVDSAVADAKKAGTDAQSQLGSYKTATDQRLDELKNIADNAIESWYLKGAPTAANPPASSWTTDALKKQHAGDLYMDTDTGYSYRWSGTEWVQVKDSDVTKALKEIESVKTTYATKSELKATNTELSGKVSDALTTAKAYTDSSISTEVTNRDAAIKAQADSISLEVSKTYAKQETFDSYKNSNDETVSNIKTTADSAASDLAEYKTSVSETYATKASLTATDSSIRSDVSSTYLSKGDAASTYATSTSLTQTASDLTTTIRTAQDTANGAASVANTTATMIRQYSGGVLVAKTGAAVGALVNANGSFDVVTLTWSDGVPTAGTEIASFNGGRARIGNATEAHVVLRPQSLVFYADETGNHLAEFTPGAVSVNDGDLKIKFGSGDIDGSNAAAIYGPTIGDGIILMPSESSNANLWICGDKAESGESAFAVHADNLMLARSGDPLKSFNMDHVIKLLGSSWQSAAVTLNTSSSLLGANSSSCYVNHGLGLAYLAIDMTFESPGWQPGTGTWLFQLPSGLRPTEIKRLYNLIQIYIGGRWGTHVDVHPDGYCYPTWGWQATNIMCATVFPLALLGL